MASITIEKVEKGYLATNHDVNNLQAFGHTKEEAFRNLESTILYYNMGVKNV